jgi:hypothetical protein
MIAEKTLETSVLDEKSTKTQLEEAYRLFFQSLAS